MVTAKYLAKFEGRVEMPHLGEAVNNLDEYIGTRYGRGENFGIGQETIGRIYDVEGMAVLTSLDKKLGIEKLTIIGISERIIEDLKRELEEILPKGVSLEGGFQE